VGIHTFNLAVSWSNDKLVFPTPLPLPAGTSDDFTVTITSVCEDIVIVKPSVSDMAFVIEPGALTVTQAFTPFTTNALIKNEVEKSGFCGYLTVQLTSIKTEYCSEKDNPHLTSSPMIVVLNKVQGTLTMNANSLPLRKETLLERYDQFLCGVHELSLKATITDSQAFPSISIPAAASDLETNFKATVTSKCQNANFIPPSADFFTKKRNYWIGSTSVIQKFYPLEDGVV